MVMKDALITIDFGTNFIVSQNDRQHTSFHLRAENERQRGAWIAALEKAKKVHE